MSYQPRVFLPNSEHCEVILKKLQSPLLTDFT